MRGKKLRELSLHILDVAENGINAGGTLIRITVIEDSKENRLTIKIADNGRGIPEDMISKIVDPFYTTRTTRKVGLGLGLFREACKRCEGDLEIRSKEGEGTEVTATFRRDHIDLPPLGDMAGTMVSLVIGNEDVDFLYTHVIDGRRFELDTRQVKAELEDVPIYNPEVIGYLTQTIREFISGS
jgi:hypothetical protein